MTELALMHGECAEAGVSEGDYTRRHKGYFPKTAEGLNDTFCFVNLNMDLYESAYQRLQLLVKEWFGRLPLGRKIMSD